MTRNRRGRNRASRIGHAIAVAVAAAAAIVPSSRATAQPADTAPPAGIAGVVHVCSSCHGPGGHSVSSTFPRLAGQQKDYIETQLKAFRDNSRADPHARTYMWGMAARLSDAQIASIAAYFAAQPPVAGTASAAADVALGRQIFTQGIAAEGVPPCMACHGAQGRGDGAVPRLAGQHSAYIERQLEAFQSAARANVVMHQNTIKMTPEQMRAVAAYVRTL